MAEEVIVKLNFVAAKKNSKLFKPAPEVVDPAVTGLYLMNSAVEKLGDPKKIEVAIRCRDD